MATNKLMEAAADILAGGKSSAPAMPPQKLEGQIVDLGGPTPMTTRIKSIRLRLQNLQLPQQPNHQMLHRTHNSK